MKVVKFQQPAVAGLPEFEGLNILEVAGRLLYQFETAENVAGVKTGKDRDGWLDDARHYKAACAFMNHLLEISERTPPPLPESPWKAPEFNAIPEMTDPMGKHWEQPADIRKAPMDEKTVELRQDQIRALKRYDCTNPSGVYNGKCWLFEHSHKLYLAWYGDSDKVDACKTEHRLVVLPAAPTAPDSPKGGEDAAA